MAEDEINRIMSGGNRDNDTAYEPIPVAEIEAIFDLPTGVTVVLMKAPPFSFSL